jgi:gibberellin 2-oxidase
MAPSAIDQSTYEPVSSKATKPIEIESWARPAPTGEDLEWAELPMIDLGQFDEPGGKKKLADQLYDAITRVGFWSVINTGLDDKRVLRQFSIGNTFFKQPLEEKRRFPCNFAEGEYFGYRENSRWIGDTGIKENVEMVSYRLSSLPIVRMESLTLM